MKYSKLVISVLVLLSLVGCSGSSSDNPPVSTTTTIKTGVFLDSPVANIGYKTETLEGVTNALGEYKYIPGETVTFFIGALEFPATQAIGVVTPLQLAGTEETANPTLVNIIRLLQTLDKDANPNNGIEITEVAKTTATQVDFGLTVADFESSSAVTDLISNAGQTSPVTQLVSSAAAIQHFEQSLDENFAVNMSQISASSVITFSGCSSVPGGWSYSFTNTIMTLTGSDGWQTPGCTLNPEETISQNMTSLANDFDIPFNCQSYPVCRSADFNKTLSGIDQDGRNFTSTYSFDRKNRKITYIKSVEGTTFTEVITLHNGFSINMSGRAASSVITFSGCPSVPGGWGYSFTNTTMTLTGSDGWQTPGCTLNPAETIPVNMTSLANDFDIPFNCQSYPDCKSTDLNKIISGTDQDGRIFFSTYSYDRVNKKLTYIKAVEGTTFTEIVTIQ